VEFRNREDDDVFYIRTDAIRIALFVLATPQYQWASALDFRGQRRKAAMPSLRHRPMRLSVPDRLISLKRRSLKYFLKSEAQGQPIALTSSINGSP
jgi:hypothetical protein